MANIELKPASEISLDQIASLWNSAFTGYIGRTPTDLTAATLQPFIAQSGIDLNLSRVVYLDGSPSGFAFIAPRGAHIRLAGMGIVAEAKGKGMGTVTIKTLVDEARARGDTIFELEVIEQNEAALKMYRRAGFEPMRQLLGWEAESPAPVGDFSEKNLEFIPIKELAGVLNQHASSDLPWQVAGFTLASYSSPDWVAVRLGGAYAMISNLEKDVVRFLSFFVIPDCRGQGQAIKLLNTLFKNYPGKKWTASPLFPGEYAERLARKFGFKGKDINQLQMRLLLQENK